MEKEKNFSGKIFSFIRINIQGQCEIVNWFKNEQGIKSVKVDSFAPTVEHLASMAISKYGEIYV